MECVLAVQTHDLTEHVFAIEELPRRPPRQHQSVRACERRVDVSRKHLHSEHLEEIWIRPLEAREAYFYVALSQRDPRALQTRGELHLWKFQLQSARNVWSCGGHANRRPAGLRDLDRYAIRAIGLPKLAIKAV